ncbi:d17ef15d-2dc0-4081-a2ce-727a586c2f54-CDS [Sclerotinia trifoliorum]|uniref:D17ef15d-2dc0-4081-a2ce-727a586c2f54-CDS n=1 Tax=Sclerotinia trifoliorum TaxID=28548 RepID=A0A8H2ZNG9_9HELO|nr:d17ef15d-2dc0-4081-a2ce-727a586c2f54-CDS [Sclerotinia trifoliorum]
MASKNDRTNATQAMRPSTAAFFNNNKIFNPPTAPAADRPRRKPKSVIDLKALTQHPLIEIISNKEISIYVEMCSHADEFEESTDISTLLAALPEYRSIKKLSLKIHVPRPHTESEEWHNYHVSFVKKLFAIIDKFHLYKLKVTMSIDKCSFPQMKFGAAVHSLRFKKWALYYQVYDRVKGIEEGPVKISRGSEYDLRLLGVYRKEFLSYLKY